MVVSWKLLSTLVTFKGFLSMDSFYVALQNLFSWQDLCTMRTWKGRCWMTMIYLRVLMQGGLRLKHSWTNQTLNRCFTMCTIFVPFPCKFCGKKFIAGGTSLILLCFHLFSCPLHVIQRHTILNKAKIFLAKFTSGMKNFVVQLMVFEILTTNLTFSRNACIFL